jgi:hypothetical protein
MDKPDKFGTIWIEDTPTDRYAQPGETLEEILKRGLKIDRRARTVEI